MAPRLHDPAVRAGLEARLRRLTPDARGRWGKMSVDQMLWHVNQAMSAGIGLVRPAADRAPLPRPMIKFLVLRLPWVRNAPTNPGFVPKEQYDFEAERGRCLSLVAKIAERPIDGVWAEHPMFGKMTGRDVSELHAKHLHHHFGQFGV